MSVTALLIIWAFVAGAVIPWLVDELFPAKYDDK